MFLPKHCTHGLDFFSRAQAILMIKISVDSEAPHTPQRLAFHYDMSTELVHGRGIAKGGDV